MQKIQTPVKLGDGKIQSLPDLINMVLEYFIFFRWIYFKNRPRGNLLLVRALLCVGILTLLYFQFAGSFELVIEGIDLDPALALGAAAVVGYWYMTSVFHKKSVHCYLLYNDILKEYGSGKKSTADILSNSFAMQLLAVDLWAHRAFTGMFARKLEDAIEFSFEQGRNKGADSGALVTRINKGKLKVREARELLEEHQNKLLEAL